VILGLLAYREGVEATAASDGHTGGNKGHPVGAHRQPANRGGRRGDVLEDEFGNVGGYCAVTNCLLRINEPGRATATFEDEVASTNRVGQKVVADAIAGSAHKCSLCPSDDTTMRSQRLTTVSRVIDLHVHSSFSDGSESPTALAELAAAAGLSAMALTDHDTTAGIAEARVAFA